MAAVAAEPVSATTTTITTATEQPGPAEERSLIPGSVSPLALLEPGAPEGAPEAWRHGADRALALSRHHRPEMQPPNPADLLEETDWRGMAVDPECAAVFLHSLPAAAPRSEPGLSLEEPDQPRASEDRAEGHGDPDPSWHTDGPTEGLACHIDGLTEQAMEHTDGLTEGLACHIDGLTEQAMQQGLRHTDLHTEGQAEGHTDLHTEGQAEGHTDPNPTGDQAMDQAPSAPPASVQALSPQGLIPGSEVRVVMDHVIDDALVVSFRLGEKVFSGVLMDVSKRFGPYGIPITVFPRRDDQSRPQVAVESEPVAVDDPSSNQTVSVGKPPPLFQEGAAYPPPLFIRDTYNQALPQPLPRKIKRPKRRYRCEEPTSIMNAIKLRPRQVLCDKCRAVMSSGRAVMSPRRRHEDGPVSSEVKRLRSDDRQLPRVTTRNGRVTSDPTGRGSDRRPSSGIRVTRGVASSSAVCLNAAKARTVLPKDTHPKGPTSIRPRQALNPNPVRPGSRAVNPPALLDRSRGMNPPAPPDRSRGMNPNLKPLAPPPPAPQGSRAVTRSSAQQGQRIHFTRLSGANVALPPRTRLKPQRYRTEDAELKPRQSPPPSDPPPSEASLAMATLELGAEPISLDSECSSSLTFNVPMCSDAATVSIPTNPVTPDSISTATAVSISADTAVSISADTAVSISAEATTVSITPDTTVSITPDAAVSIPPDTAVSIPPDTVVSITPDTASTPSPSSGPGADSIPADPDSAARADSEELKTRRRATCPTSGLSKSVSKCFLPDGRSVCVGDIVWAKIYGFPWWPARVLGISVLRRGEANVQEARVSWFGSPTTSVLALAALSPFLESFQTRFDRKRKGPYRRAIAEAASAAKQLTPEVRALLTQFET